MSFHLCAITATELPNESILDYTYISEENFLLVIALTSKGLNEKKNIKKGGMKYIYRKFGNLL